MRPRKLKPKNRKPSTTVGVTLQIPTAIAPQFGRDAGSIARRLIEFATLEGYRSNQLSRGDVAQMLDMDWAETEEFLAKHHCDRHCDIRELAEDRQNLDQILGPGKPAAE